MDQIFRHLGREVERYPIEKLSTYKNNARRHSKKQLRKLADTIKNIGYMNPIIVDEKDMVLAGAGRLEAAKLLKLAHIPIVRITGLNRSQKRAYMVADNRLHDESEFDESMLKIELEELSMEGFDLEQTGFDSIEIDKILALDNVEPEDNVHLPPETREVVARIGDFWHLGAHRLIVGDARDPEVYGRLLGGERAEMIFTDPPYNCPIENNVSGLGKVRHANFVMGAGETSFPEFASTILRPAFKCMAAYAQPAALAFICTDWRASYHLQNAAQGVFEEQKNLIVWAKTNAGMGTTYRSAHELIHLYKISPGKHINNFGLGEGGRHRSNVWQYAGANVFRKGRMQDLADHSTVKPKKMVADAMIDCSRRGGLILDPFCGSGTTLVAAHETGRRGYGIELDPKYADVILRRVFEATGVTPLLDGTVPFDEVAAERLGRTGENET